MAELHRQSAVDIANAVRAGRVQAVEICASALAHIERIGSPDSGFIKIFRERALLRAEAVDKIVQAGLDPGRLAGVPFGVADHFDVALQPTTAGSRLSAEGPFAHRDAKAIMLLEAAGAVLVGRQNMDEFTYGFVTVNAHYGTTPNPHDKDRLAGGACGGSAVAVANETVPISLASDINGSIRIPAALCGVIGLAPTYGDFPNEGTQSLVESLDVVGPVARQIDDVVLVRDVLRDGAPERSAVPRGPLRFGRLKGWFDQNVEDPMRAAMKPVWEEFGRVSLDLKHVDLARAAASLIIAAEGANLHRASLVHDPGIYGATTRDRLLAGLLMPADDYLQAIRFQTWIRTRAQQLFEHCDVFITPAAPGFAPLIEDPFIEFDGVRTPARSHLGIYTQPISLMGLPSIVLPLAHSGPLPLGVQLIAAPGGEQTLFEAASLLFKNGIASVPGVPESQ
ncbi:amidase [Novosphingobium endophyticum]|uniref:Amidase n=1 Tax=Novosphingobium endophyticum TaxID=1955250 RepID=A0A916X6V4_9SPHN|nr:AtzE family amidohydrolase [Novosphingobium endophyticum]GGC12063.1 amidase [Novosphingobium endophyticum]